MRSRLAVALFVPIMLMTACSGNDREPSRKASATATASPAWPKFDPPTRFDQHGVPLPGEALSTDVLLYQTTAFVATTEELVRVDLPTGQATAVMSPERAPLSTTPRGAPIQVDHVPVLVTLGGRPAVAVPYPVTIPPQGTTRGGIGLDLLIADAATGKKTSVVRVDLADDEIDDNRRNDHEMTVVGQHDSTVVVSVD